MQFPGLQEEAERPQHRKLFQKQLKYGTAGFRDVADALPMDSVFFRMGIVAGLRSKAVGASVGVMVTASHNPPADNGIKIVDFDGGMLAPFVEPICEEIANAGSQGFHDLVVDIAGRMAKQGRAGDGSGQNTQFRGAVVLGCDTRESSARLARCVERGVEAVGARVENYGLLTTPQVHHIVRMQNSVDLIDSGMCRVSWASEEGFYQMLLEGLDELVATSSKPVIPPVLVDCAGGVGAVQLAKIQARLQRILSTTVDIVNPADDPATLNSNCGAEFVQKGRRAPNGLRHQDVVSRRLPEENLHELHLVSFDGDADRIVFHTWRDDSDWQLLDGDKIAALLGTFVGKELAAAGIRVGEGGLSFACVQTAYANGAATRFLTQEMKVQVAMGKTGVKYVEHVAQQYDIGVYFEANGHGTVIVQPKAFQAIKNVLDNSPTPEQKQACQRLLAFVKVVNQAVGDAISLLLAVEGVLACMDMTIDDWVKMYKDVPSRQGKVLVPDRLQVKTTEDETQVTEPQALQQEISRLCSEVECGRAFIRPSGTENAVRVYAEAATAEAANLLAFKVAQTTWKMLGGEAAAEPKGSEYNVES
mmetsp:Transcript_98880/g.264420  ORF Transcript_98880/g.264420 Transcript_98880/m.264420 type:complete len:589 (+) Transcript_98880:16-1782(+)